MLGSFPSPIAHDQDPQDHDDHHHHPSTAILPYQIINTPLPPSPRAAYHHTPRQFLVRCAELISANDFTSAHCILSFLRSTAYGDSSERLSHLFAKALSSLLTHPNDHLHWFDQGMDIDIDIDILSSAYLSLNQVTPFLRFSHLTANQAILEAVAGHHSVHILDFNLLQGLQWPPLMQALASSSNPPTIRLTATGPEPVLLNRTGSRLKKFAASLGLKFHFHPVHLSPRDPASIALLPSAVALLPGESLAVNAAHFLHRLLDDERSSATALLLDKIKAMSPKVVTLSEIEASHNSPNLAVRVEAALGHYTAIFESMEATLPPNSKERMAVEQVWFGREITGVVSATPTRMTRHERFEVWEEMMRETGFESVGWSGFSVSQAKLLLRLHYPSEGYRLQVAEGGKCIFLGWQDQPLFTVSSWR